MQDVFKLLLPAKPRVVSSMFAQTAFAREWQRWYMQHVSTCDTLVPGREVMRHVGKRVERRKDVRPVADAYVRVGRVAVSDLA